MNQEVSHVQPRELVFECDERARMEIEMFLKALDSYPKIFARNPRITFKQHLIDMVLTQPTMSPRAR
jgi:hypothetical protein